MTDDGWEIRQLVEAYAGNADRGDADAVAALFTTDGVLAMWLEPGQELPTASRHGRTEIATAITRLSAYRFTQHLIGSCVIDVTGTTATAETQCTAHHISDTDTGPVDRTLYLRYSDRFTRTDAGWRFARRELRVQWVATTRLESG
jgi:uncharacterized protein (TIGR02246 family)